MSTFCRPIKGVVLTALCDIPTGGLICRDEALLTVFSNPDMFLRTPLATYLNTLLRQYGDVVQHEGHAFVLCSFLLEAKKYPRDTDNPIWDLVRERTPGAAVVLEGKLKDELPRSWFYCVEALDAVRDIATALHDVLPEPWCDLISLEECVRLLAVYDLNALSSQVADAPRRTGLCQFARCFEHSCNPNAQICFLVSGSDKHLRTTTVQVNAMREIRKGEAVAISYIPLYRPTLVRQQLLRERYYFNCQCEQCTTLPDLCRAFRCWLCPRNEGVVTPVGDGTKHELWACLQCGVRPTEEKIHEFENAEEEITRIKADKTVGMFKLMDNPSIHYTHYHVFQKLDAWSEQSWKEQDARLCENYVETLVKCADRVLSDVDVTKAQYHEFLGQLHHALGNAHTARHEYQLALKIRERAGQGNTSWGRKTRYMALDKPITELMDSK